MAKRQSKPITRESPRVPGTPGVLFVRADGALLDALEGYIAAEEHKVAGRHLTRADAVRELLHVALALT